MSNSRRTLPDANSNAVSEALSFYERLLHRSSNQSSKQVQTIGQLLEVIHSMKHELLAFRKTLDFYQNQAIDSANSCAKLESELDDLRSSLSKEPINEFALAYASLNQQLLDLQQLSDASLLKLRQEYDLSIGAMEAELLSLKLNLANRLHLEDKLEKQEADINRLKDELAAASTELMRLEEIPAEMKKKKNKKRTKILIDAGKNDETVFNQSETADDHVGHVTICSAEIQTILPYPDWACCLTDDEYR